MIKKERSAGAVIFRRENDIIYYLLLFYSQKHWDFPKGHLEDKETDEDAARREIKEETGITDLAFVSGFKKEIKYYFRGKNVAGKKNLISKSVAFFLAESHTKEVKISFEHEAFEWLPYEQAFERVTFKNSKNILKSAHKFIMRNSGL